MTVAATTNRKTYTGDNVTTSFATSPVIFYLSSNLQVRVTVIATGVSTLLTENTHYTVSGGSSAGAVGTVSLVGGSSPHGALLSTEKLVILRVLPLTQGVDLVNNNNSDAEVLETALDKLTDVDQQIQEQADRAIRFASGDTSGSSTELPDSSVRAGRLLGFDALGALTTYVVQAATSLIDLAASTGSALIGFIQAGTGAMIRTLQAKLRDETHILDFGATGDDVADDNAHLQAFLNKGGRLILGGGKTYRNAAANLTFVANTELIIERGTTLHLAGTRLTALNVNDVQIHNHGVISSTALNITDSLPTNWQARGIVEFGGTIASPAQRVGIDGPGEVTGDFVGTPGTIAISPTDRRRGILFSYVISGWAKFNNIHGIIGEAILYNGTTPTNDKDIDIVGNRIHDCNHDAISHVGVAVTSFRSRGNIGWNCLNGIEASAGDHQHNLMFSMIGSSYGFGGNTASDSVSPVIFANNTGVNSGTNDFDFEGATSAGGVVVIQNNTSHGAGGFAFVVSYAKLAVVTGNKADGWGAIAVGSGMAISNCTNYVCDGNVLANENVAHSNGGFNISGVGVWGGGNVTVGVILPFVSAFGIQALGQILRTSIPTTVTGATYTVLATDSDIIANRAGTVTLTLESAANIPGKRLVVRTIQAQTVVSASGNVVPLIGGAAGTAILAATAGKWAELKSDGTNWQIMAGN